MDVSAAIREITDREQIWELAHQYCFGLDGGNLGELSNLFAESARLIIKYPGRRVRQFDGRQAIYEFDCGFYQRVEILRHKVNNQIIEAARRSGFLEVLLGLHQLRRQHAQRGPLFCAVTGRTGSSKKGWCG